MGYHKQDGVFADVKIASFFPQTMISSAATVTGPVVEVGDATMACLDLVCSSLTASDTVDAKIQTSKDGTTWRDVGAFAQLTASGSERKSFTGLDRFARASVTTADAGGGITAIVSIAGDLK